MTDREGLDQEWSELVEELRLALPGAEVLFGFLLVLPFQESFAALTAVQRGVHFAALLSAAVACVLLISPSVSHRLQWRQGDKEALLRYATRLSIAATLCIAVAMVAVVWLITDLQFGQPATTAVAAGLAVIFGWFWYGYPLVRRARRSGR